MGLSQITTLYGHRFDGDPMPGDYRRAIERITRDMDRLEGFEGPRSKAAYLNLKRLRYRYESTLRRIEFHREMKETIRERGRV